MTRAGLDGLQRRLAKLEEAVASPRLVLVWCDYGQKPEEVGRAAAAPGLEVVVLMWGDHGREAEARA